MLKLLVKWQKKRWRRRSWRKRNWKIRSGEDKIEKNIGKSLLLMLKLLVKWQKKRLLRSSRRSSWSSRIWRRRYIINKLSYLCENYEIKKGRLLKRSRRSWWSSGRSSSRNSSWRLGNRRNNNLPVILLSSHLWASQLKIFLKNEKTTFTSMLLMNRMV